MPLQIYFINIFLKYSENFLNLDNLNKFVYKVVIIFNPLFILWCTSLRWYSLWVPMALAIIGIFYFKRKLRQKDIKIILIIASLMFHLSYLTIIFIASIFISKPKIFLNFILKNKITMFLILIINLPQFYYFIFYHLEASAGQVSNLYNFLIFLQ